MQQSLAHATALSPIAFWNWGFLLMQFMAKSVLSLSEMDHIQINSSTAETLV
jgi:hypothetical protein